MKLMDLIGKEVKLYPSDTHSKWGVIEEISEHGFLITITQSRDKNYTPGERRFFSHSAGLTFSCQCA